LREVLVLRYHGGLAFREIAATLRRPLGTVLWQARKGLDALRDVLGKQHGQR
jgi:DNA-directed RNA polymerase specialized sigma24 family protein